MVKRPRCVDCVDCVEKRSLELGELPGLHESIPQTIPTPNLPALSKFERLSKPSFTLQFAPRLV